MGDLVTLAQHLGISSVNTILLAVIGTIIKIGFRRIQLIEEVNERQGRSIAFIKGRLEIHDEE